MGPPGVEGPRGADGAPGTVTSADIRVALGSSPVDLPAGSTLDGGALVTEARLNEAPIALAAGSTLGGAPIQVKVSGSCAPGTALKSVRADGTVECAPTELANVLTVSADGGMFTTVQAALAATADAGTNNRYLVKVGPGSFTGALAVVPPFVTVAGAGPELTRLQFQVNLGADATLRDLSIAAFNTAVRVDAAAGEAVLEQVSLSGQTGLDVRSGAAKVRRSLIRGTGSTAPTAVEAFPAAGTTIGLDIDSCDIRAVATGAAVPTGIGVFLTGNIDMSVRNSTIEAGALVTTRNGIWLNNGAGGAGRVVVQGSSILGTSRAVYVTGSAATVGIIGTQLEGTAAGTCAGVYDENFVFYPSTCPP